MTNFAETRKTSAAYKAAVLLIAEGPMESITLYSRISFGDTSDGRTGTLKRALKHGWLVRNDLGLIDVSDEARSYLESSPQEVARSVGTIATAPVINLLTRPPLSSKYKLNPRGTRQDVPEWSKRPEGFSLRSVV